MTEISLEDVAGWISQHFRRMFHSREGTLELHLSLLNGVAERYRGPVLQRAAEIQPPPDRRVPRTADLPGQIDRELALDQGHDRLLWPGHLPRRDVRHLRGSRLAAGTDRPAARRPGPRGRRPSDRGTRIFATNGTSTANKIVSQALVQPGDIVLVDRNCHQSHHYGLMLSGAHVIYLDAYPLNEYSMYGAVPLRDIKEQLLALRRAGKLDRVKMLMLTNCTFDGMVYDIAAGDGGVPGDQAGPGVPLGRGLVRFRPVPPDLPATDRDAIRRVRCSEAPRRRVPPAVRIADRRAARRLGREPARTPADSQIRRAPESGSTRPSRRTRR